METAYEVVYTFKIGERYRNNKGFWFTITGEAGYIKQGKKRRRLLKIKFDSGYETTVISKTDCLQQARDGGQLNVFGIATSWGMSYKAHGNRKHLISKEAKMWYGMLRRCYNPVSPDEKKYQEKGVIVSNRWLNLVNFLEDLPNLPNYALWKQFPNKYSLDKDYLISGNKVYSREACSFQDKPTQMLYRNIKLGKSGIRGITWNSHNQNWDVYVNFKKVSGNIPSIEEAKVVLTEALKPFPNFPQSRFGLDYNGAS